MTGAQIPCPACGAGVETDYGFVPWCAECDWGVNPTAEETAEHGRLERWWRRHLNSVSSREHERLLVEGMAAPRGRDRYVALALATAVHLVSASLVVLLVMVVLSPVLLFFKLLFAVVLVGILVEVTPWRPGARPAGVVLTREKAPELFSLLGELAGLVGVRPPATVVVTDDVNAGWGLHGWRRHRYLVVGLPLWAVLEAQAKVAVLGHELGHECSGDPRRSWPMDTALGALAGWWVLLVPPARLTRVRASGSGLVGYRIKRVAVIPLIPVAVMLGLLFYLLATLALRSGQRAEHVADKTGAWLGGTAGMISAHGVLINAESLDFALDVDIRRNGRDDLWERARAFIPSVPPRERARLLRRAEITQQRVDASHPPTSRRLDLLAALPELTPFYMLDVTREAAVDRELRQAEAAIVRSLRGAAPAPFRDTE